MSYIRNGFDLLGDMLDYDLSLTYKGAAPLVPVVFNHPANFTVNPTWETLMVTVHDPRNMALKNKVSSETSLLGREDYEYKKISVESKPTHVTPFTFSTTMPAGEVENMQYRPPALTREYNGSRYVENFLEKYAFKAMVGVHIPETKIDILFEGKTVKAKAILGSYVVWGTDKTGACHVLSCVDKGVSGKELHLDLADIAEGHQGCDLNEVSLKVGDVELTKVHAILIPKHLYTPIRLIINDVAALSVIFPGAAFVDMGDSLTLDALDKANGLVLFRRMSIASHRPQLYAFTFDLESNWGSYTRLNLKNYLLSVDTHMLGDPEWVPLMNDFKGE